MRARTKEGRVLRGKRKKNFLSLSPVREDLLDRLDVLDGGERVAGLGELEPGLGVGLGGLDGADDDGAALAGERGSGRGRRASASFFFFFEVDVELKRMKEKSCG